MRSPEQDKALCRTIDVAPFKQPGAPVSGFFQLVSLIDGDDEFIVVLEASVLEPNATIVGQKIQNTLSQPFRLSGHTVHISSSIGIAVYPQHRSRPVLARIIQSFAAHPFHLR